MKKLKIVVGVHGRPSTMQMFQNIQRENCEHVIKASKFEGFVIRKDPNNIKKKERIVTNEKLDCKSSVVIRWGWYGNIETDEKTIVYNKAEAIKLVNDKGQCRRFLSEKGIAIPETYLINEIPEMLANDKLEYPIIARPSHHGRGQNLWVCENSGEIQQAIHNGAMYFSKVYPKTEEYGVHVFLGKVLACMRKPAPDDVNKIAWNRAQNDKPFEVVPQKEYKNYICKLALEATKAVGLDFGRVDVMVQRTDKNLPKAVICEINTAPTINSSPYVLTRWSKAFNKIARSEKRIEHWDFNQFELAESLAWKENQLTD